MMTDTWREHAACRGVHVAVFFGHNPEPRAKMHGDDDVAKAVCAGCPVIDDCRREHAGEPQGVWFGTTAVERGFKEGTRQYAPKQPQLIEELHTFLALHPDTDYSQHTAFEALGRRWTRNSLRAALRQLHAEGRALRSGGGRDSAGRNTPYLYRWNPAQEDQ